MYEHFSILSGSHRENRGFIVPTVFPPSMEAAGVNRPQQICCVNWVPDSFQETQTAARLTGCTRY